MFDQLMVKLLCLPLTCIYQWSHTNQFSSYFFTSAVSYGIMLDSHLKTRLKFKFTK